MLTLTASEAQNQLYRLIDQTAESHEPIIITGKKTDAILLSTQDWTAIQETLYSHLFGKNPRLQAGKTSVLAHVKIPACFNIGPP